MKVDALLLDADGVVQTHAIGREAALESIAGGRKGAAEVLEELFEEELPCLKGEADFVERIGRVVERWGSVVTVDDALAAWTAIQRNDEVLDLIAGVRARGIQVALTSTQEAYRARHMAVALDY